jgi:PAS domain S-box-containing protein
MTESYRVLVVDDDTAIRATYRHILQPPVSELTGLEALISGTPAAPGTESEFQVEEADQGEAAAAIHREALARGMPFHLAFIDMRMPPGWDGMRTAVALRAQDPSIYIVIATAFSDYDVNALQAALGHDVVLLRKPFNQEEVYQLSRTLCQSWMTRRRLETVTAELESRVLARTAELDRRMTQQQALAEIAAQFIEEGVEGNIDDTVAWSLARIGRVIDVDICGLYLMDAQQGNFSLSHEWAALGVKPLGPKLEALSRSDIMPAYARFLRGDAYGFQHLRELPSEMEELRASLAGHIESCLAVPIEIGGRLAGILAVGHVQANTAWDSQLEQFLRTAGHVIARALEAHDIKREIIEKQTLLRATQHAAHIGNWHLAAGTSRIHWDEELRRIAGLNGEQEVSLQVLSTLVHPEDWPTLEASLMTSLRQGVPHRMEYRLRRPDGGERWLASWAEPQRDAGGHIVRLVGMLQDISENRRREERLMLLSEAVEQGPASVVITDVTGNIEYVNRRFTEVTGYSREEALGRNPRIMQSGHTPVETYAVLWNTILAGGRWAGILENRRKNGELYTERAIIQGMKDEHGRVTHLLAVKEDITEREIAEAALAESEAKYRSIVETADEGIWQVDREWNTTYVNRRMEQMLGWTPGAMLGRPIGDFVDAEGRKQLRELRLARKQGVRETHDLIFTRADGGPLEAMISATPIIDAHGVFTGITALVTDISRRKRLESSLLATAEFVSRAAGPDFCRELVRHTARTLGLDYVHIARLLPGQERVEVQAAWLDGAWISTGSYDLANTPCRDTIHADRVRIDTGVQTLFPLDQDLKTISAQSYVGEPILDEHGRVTGLIVGISHAALPGGDIVQANLRILAARAAAHWVQGDATRTLRNERDTSQNILQTVEAMIVALDREGRITLANRKGCELLGYREEELIGQDWITTCLPGDIDVDQIRAILRKSLAEDLSGAEYFENPVRTRSGMKRLIAWHNSVLRDSDGKVIGMLGTGEDITESRAAEVALRESEGRFRALIEHLPHLAVQGYGADGTVNYWNQASTRLYGYSEEEALGANLLDLIIPPAMRDAVAQTIREFVESGREIPPQELVLRHKDGSDVPVYSSHVLVTASGGEAQLFCLDVDIAERKRMETELRDAERSRETLLANLPGMAYRCLADDDWTLLYVSTGVLELTGYSREDLVGDQRRLHYARIIHPEDTRRVADEVMSAMREQRPFELDYRIIHADGTVRRVWERGRQTSPPGREPALLEGFIAYMPGLSPTSG